MEKEIGKVRYKEAVHSDKVVSVVWTRKIRIAFVVHLLVKIIIEIIFMFFIIAIQQMQVRKLRPYFRISQNLSSKVISA